MAHGYTLRMSPRAKRVLVRVAPGKGVEVVLPKGADPALAEQAVREKAQWIDQARARFARQGLSLEPRPIRLPEAVALPSLGEVWPVAKVRDWPWSRKGDQLLENAGTLLVRGADDAARCALLREWVRKLAKAWLPERLRMMSRRTGLGGYQRVAVRLQRTRWGSCSTRGTISLNAKLLFLPLELTDHALVHELCHLRHQNHGPRFKALLTRHAPDQVRLERELSHAGRHVPDWMNRQ